MTTQLWIGFGFLTLLVLFLIVSFFLAPRLTEDQRGTVKFLSSLCAGFSGGFLTGGALFEMHKTTGATTFGISGTAGCALFFVLWFFYPKVFRLEDAFAFSLPKGWTFRDAADRMARSQGHVLDCVGFKKAELNAAMQDTAVTAKSLTDALTQLRYLAATPNAVRPYDVTLEGSIYRLTIR